MQKEYTVKLNQEQVEMVIKTLRQAGYKALEDYDKATTSDEQHTLMGKYTLNERAAVTLIHQAMRHNGFNFGDEFLRTK